jgi:hypothetical protein
VSRFFRQPSAADSTTPAELKFETKEKEKKKKFFPHHTNNEGKCDGGQKERSNNSKK